VLFHCKKTLGRRKGKQLNGARAGRGEKAAPPKKRSKRRCPGGKRGLDKSCSSTLIEGKREGQVVSRKSLTRLPPHMKERKEKERGLFHIPSINRWGRITSYNISFLLRRGGKKKKSRFKTERVRKERKGIYRRAPIPKKEGDSLHLERDKKDPEFRGSSTRKGIPVPGRKKSSS